MLKFFLRRNVFRLCQLKKILIYAYVMHKYENAKKVAVVGGSGYAGLELVRLLMRHPAADLKACFSAHPSFTFGDYLPSHQAKGIAVVDLKDLDRWAPQLNTVFLATPAEVSMELAPKLLDAGAHVVDLSGAFRLPTAAAYKEWYGHEHTCARLLEKAEYGLVPWASGKVGSAPRLIANPGCYATAALMALIPLLQRRLIDAETIVIDAKSGTSGAGRKASQNLLFTEVEGECLPYRVGRHQHLPELSRFAHAFGGQEIDPWFTTHLLSVRRGIICGIYARLTRKPEPNEICAAYATDYSDYGLVDWGPIKGDDGRADAYALSLKRVVGGARTRIHYHAQGDRLYLFSLIDNLIKGAAGQAIENFNRLQGLAPSASLEELEGVL